MPQAWAVLFFFMLIMLGLDSQVIMFLTVYKLYNSHFARKPGKSDTASSPNIVNTGNLFIYLTELPDTEWTCQLVVYYSVAFCVIFMLA